MSKKLTIILALLFIGFASLGIYSVRTADRKLQKHNIELLDNAIQYKKLELEKQELNQEYEKATKDHTLTEEKVKQLEAEKEKLEEQYRQLEISKAKEKEQKTIANSVTPQASASAEGNESIAWNFLISQGFTRNQTAGIMGNLRQEHNFKTDDVKGGLGIAQWLGARRARLISKGNHLDINTQLNFLMEELNTSEKAAYNAIKATDSVEGATIAFQNKFERCGICVQSRRVQYSYDILKRY